MGIHYQQEWMPMATNNIASERFGWSVNDWAAAAGISRASVYELLGEDKLETVKFGGKRLILTHPRAWLISLHGVAA
jgi:hypothetical protein